MKRIIFFVLALTLLLLLMGCAALQPTTMREIYPLMYSEPPVSILILPPVNNTTSVDAKEYFSCSLSEALGLKGYYPLPVEAVFDILRDEGLYDTESYTYGITTGNPTVFANLKQYFGADAVLYSTINKWDKSWFLTTGYLTIDADFALLSTDTAETLWDYGMTTQVSLDSGSDNLLLAALESAVKTVFEDYFSNARVANIRTFDEALPYGTYHPESNTDGETEIPLSKHGFLQINK